MLRCRLRRPDRCACIDSAISAQVNVVVLASDELARAYRGLDSPSREPMIDQAIDEGLAEDTAMLSEIARQRLGRMVKFHFREHFHADFKQAGGMVHANLPSQGYVFSTPMIGLRRVPRRAYPGSECGEGWL